MITIDYYMFTLSPFTYLAGDRLEKIADRYGAKINYKPFNLMQVFEKTGGTPPKDRHISRQIYRAQEIRRVADHNEMKVTEKPVYWPTNPAPSCYAIIAAQEAGGGDIGGLCQTILKSCWLEDKDIALIKYDKEKLSEYISDVKKIHQNFENKFRFKNYDKIKF